MQIIITKRELEDENYSLLTEVFSNNEVDPDRKKIKLDYTADYKKLISLLLGSLYVNFQSQTFSNSDHIKRTFKRLTGGASQVDRAEFPDQPVQFTELKSKALGDIQRKEPKLIYLLQILMLKVLTDIFSILFWTPEQKKLIDSFSNNESIVLLGDYGTGKTVVIQSVAEKLRNSGRDLVYINALDTTDCNGEEFYKTWEDVLDVIVKLRLPSGVTVLDMGTLRRQYLERSGGRVLFRFKKPN